MSAAMRALVIAAVVLAAAPAALATPGSAPPILYGGAGQGRVVFDGRLHLAKGLRCGDCHGADLFATKKRALIAMADHGADRACFHCHDGSRAFDACDGCHRK